MLVLLLSSNKLTLFIIPENMGHLSRAEVEILVIHQEQVCELPCHIK